jgi:hypothetical protein
MRHSNDDTWSEKAVKLLLQQIESWGKFTRFAILMTIVGIGGLKVLGSDSMGICVLVLVFGAMWTALLARYLKLE